MQPPLDKNIEGLKQYYNVKHTKDQWQLYCKKCGKGWGLKKSSSHAGNILHLLNHARSHDPGAEQPDED